ncbi:response regulator [Reichenbachiella carrageenanivorans]|uniref:Response regulator n=1 Tax=Reichenbachiella carrageenanivorans TaxID=2979869 RepID=A0ABY6D467_9BACT|nr:response regulator [Reichenbachiella carrageenanivorans]UXX78650.1 response regulator [Reichenbachiella carrageenanivorans]
MSEIKILIVEDEMIIAEDMSDMLQSLGYDVIGVTGELDEAKQLLDELAPDIAMVDITLGVKQEGLDFAQYIKDHHDMPFIFCTSHADKSTIDKATPLHPSGYLVKPFTQKDLYSAIQVALANFANDQPKTDKTPIAASEDLVIKDSIFIKNGHLYIKVKFDDMLWISPDGNYASIQTVDNTKHLVRMPLKDFQDQLPTHKFYRTHRSYLVNIDRIEGINNQHVYLGEHQIPLGKNYREELLSLIKKLS